jgi:hypothetical protein
MHPDRDDILKFYEEFRSRDGWERLEAMCIFLRTLFRERSLDDCSLFTSHEALCITRYPTYDQRRGQPLLSINCTSKDRLQFEFRIELEREPVSRAIIESANCPLDLGLTEFDRLYAKFLEAHKQRPSGSEG